jgi:hypothetical protein
MRGNSYSTVAGLALLAFLAAFTSCLNVGALPISRQAPQHLLLHASRKGYLASLASLARLRPFDRTWHPLEVVSVKIFSSQSAMDAKTAKNAWVLLATRSRPSTAHSECAHKQARGTFWECPIADVYQARSKVCLVPLTDMLPGHSNARR